MVPLSTQGSGKTYYYENILEPYFKTQNKLHLKLLSSDKVNLKLVEKYLSQNRRSNKTEAFQKTRYLYKEAYEEEIKNIFAEIYNDALKLQNSNKIIFFIYIDKNHPLNDASQAPVHQKIRRISEFDDLKFISLAILAREVSPKTNEIVKFQEKGEM